VKTIITTEARGVRNVDGELFLLEKLVMRDADNTRMVLRSDLRRAFLQARVSEVRLCPVHEPGEKMARIVWHYRGGSFTGSPLGCYSNVFLLSDGSIYIACQQFAPRQAAVIQAWAKEPL
jgi:hypothetical protein